jgi:hypothetical protein
VTDANGQAVPAVLNVQIDEIPLAESDALEQPMPPIFLYTTTETPRLPLVFDNALEQAKQVNQSLSNWLTEQQESRRRSALWLLGGSGLGFCMLLAAWPLKWLPKARFWLPVAALLACSAALGARWMQATPTATAQIAAADPLTTHGVQSTLPAPESIKAPSHEQGIERRTKEEKLARTDFIGVPFADIPLALDDRLSPVAETDGARPATPGQTLLAMEDWDHLDATGSHLPAIAADHSISLRGERKERLFGAAALGLAWKKPDDSASGALGASSSTAAASRAGDLPTHRTLYWHPRLVADSGGICRVRFPVPQSRLAIRLVVLAHSGQQVGAASKMIPTVVDVSRN